MAFARTWTVPETAPANADNISAGAQEIRNLSDDIRERFDTVLTDGTLPAPPATLANVDTRFNVATDPPGLRLRGDRVDLRGYTWRRQRTTLASGAITITATAFAALPAPGPITLTITPVSSASVLVFTFSSLITFIPGSAIGLRAAVLRIRNTTDGTDVLSGAGVSNNASTTLKSQYITIGDSVTGLSGAKTFEVQARKTNASDSFNLTSILDTGNTDSPMIFTCIEQV